LREEATGDAVSRLRVYKNLPRYSYFIVK